MSVWMKVGLSKGLRYSAGAGVSRQGFGKLNHQLDNQAGVDKTPRAGLPRSGVFGCRKMPDREACRTRSVPPVKCIMIPMPLRDALLGPVC